MGIPGTVVTPESVLDAHTPHDIFGDLSGRPEEQLREARRIYAEFAKVTHPDTSGESGEAFAKLADMWSLASAMIASGTYGDPGFAGLTVNARRRTYHLGDRIARGDIADVHLSDHGVVKIARRPRNNDLLRSEAKTLRHLRRETPDVLAMFFPDLTDTLGIRDASHHELAANVFEPLPGGPWVTASDVMAFRPGGIDPRDAAWMWRRILVAIGTTHEAGYVHHAVLPDHVLILPEKHGLVLVDWCYATEIGAKPVAIVPRYREWYPDEVGATRQSDPATDIFMGAKVAIALMGGDPVTGTMPRSVPTPLRAFFRACTLRHVSRRPDDARRLLESYDEIIERLWGPRTFRPFHMPDKGR